MLLQNPAFCLYIQSYLQLYLVNLLKFVTQFLESLVAMKSLLGWSQSLSTPLLRELQSQTPFAWVENEEVRRRRRRRRPSIAVLVCRR